MRNQLGLSIARIFASNDTIAGAGFLVSAKRVLTCAHVIAQALNIAQETQDAPSGEVRLDFPLLAPRQIYRARVVFWKPVQPNVPVLPAGSEDIAGLLLETDSPEGSEPARF